MWAFLADADRALGFGLADAAAPIADESGSDPRIDGLVAEREAARAAKDYATSDRIRDELAAEGVELDRHTRGSHVAARRLDVARPARGRRPSTAA